MSFSSPIGSCSPGAPCGQIGIVCCSPRQKCGVARIESNRARRRFEERFMPKSKPNVRWLAKPNHFSPDISIFLESTIVCGKVQTASFNQMRYFDYNATAPLHPEAAKTWLEAS